MVLILPTIVADIITSQVKFFPMCLILSSLITNACFMGSEKFVFLFLINLIFSCTPPAPDYYATLISSTYFSEQLCKVLWCSLKNSSLLPKNACGKSKKKKKTTGEDKLGMNQLSCLDLFHTSFTIVYPCFSHRSKLKICVSIIVNEQKKKSSLSA